MLTGIIVAALLYVALFVAFWGETRFSERATSKVRATVRVTPWGEFLFIEAPSESAAADALLRVDLHLAREGK